MVSPIHTLEPKVQLICKARNRLTLALGIAK